MKRLTLLLGVATLAVGAFAVAAPAQGPGYSVAETEIGTLMDDPAARKIVDRHLPGFSASPQTDMARSMTLQAYRRNAPDQISDAKLAEIQAELAKLPRR